MADDKSKRGNRDRSKVAGAEDYEINYLTEKTGITADQARELIRSFGNNRKRLEEEARKLHDKES